MSLSGSQTRDPRGNPPGERVKSANSNRGTTGLHYSVSSGTTKAESGEEKLMPTKSFKAYVFCDANALFVSSAHETKCKSDAKKVTMIVCCSRAKDMWLDSDIAASQLFSTTDCGAWEMMEPVTMTCHAADRIPNLPASRISLQPLGFAVSVSSATDPVLGMWSTLHVIAEGCKGTSCLLTWYFSARKFNCAKIKVALTFWEPIELLVTFLDISS